MSVQERYLYIVTPHNGNSVARVEIYSHSPGWPDIPEPLRAALTEYASEVGGHIVDNIQQRS
jgi:hypothetical protein